MNEDSLQVRSALGMPVDEPKILSRVLRESERQFKA
jgi:hypothetical protein